MIEELLAAVPRPELYDPAVHVRPERMAREWHMHEHTALDKLRKIAPGLGWVEVQVINPETGHTCVAFKKK